MEAVC